MTRTSALLAAALMLVAPAARGADAPHADDAAQNLRDFTLRNQASKTIAEAHAYTTLGKDIDLTRDGAIRPELNQSFSMGQNECLDRIQLRFADGVQINRVNLNDCRNTQLTARDDDLAIDSNAGGPTFPSERSRNNPGGVQR